MIDVSSYLNRAAQHSGYKREYYKEKNIPTQTSNIVAVPFYGDIRSTCVFSSLVLNRIREQHKDKYLILCSWPGFRSLFPYVDEYWSVSDDAATKTLATDANNFYNDSNLSSELSRSLLEVFDVISTKDIRTYYDHGFTQKYWEGIEQITRFMPEVPSASRLSPDFLNQLSRNNKRKVIVFPATKMRSRQQGKTMNLSVSKDFWVTLIKRLLKEDLEPVVYQNWFTYNVSTDFVDQCVYLVPRSVSDALAAFRHVGHVLDVHTGISRLAIAARCPFVCATERKIFVEDRDYEIDDLCCDGLPRRYTFSFSTNCMYGTEEEWNTSVIDNVVIALKESLSTSHAELPSTTGSSGLVPYDLVRQRKANRMGITFINSSKKK